MLLMLLLLMLLLMLLLEGGCALGAGMGARLVPLPAYAVWQGIKLLHDALLARIPQRSAVEAHSQNLITTTHARVMSRTTFAAVARADASFLLRSGGGGAVGGGNRRGTALADMEAVGRALILHDNACCQIASHSAA